MALRYSDGSFVGGKLPAIVEEVVARYVVEACARSPRTNIRRLYGSIAEEMWRCGRPPVSPAALRTRVKAFQKHVLGQTTHRHVFCDQLPLDFVVVDESGRQLGRPLITLSGIVDLKGGRTSVKAKIDISYPTGTAKTRPLSVRHRNADRLSRSGCAGKYQAIDILPAGVPLHVTPMRRAAVRRVRPTPEAQYVLGIFEREGPQLRFDRIVESLGDAEAGLIIRQLVLDGTLIPMTPGVIGFDTVLRLRQRTID